MTREPLGIAVLKYEVLTLVAWSNIVATLRAFVHIRPSSGGDPYNITIDNILTSNRLVNNATYVLQEAGIIDGIGVIFSGSGATQRGQTYAQMTVQNGPVLARGYVFIGHPLALGDRDEPGPAGGHGNMRVISLGTPAAGANHSAVTVPTGAIWAHRGFNAQLVTAVAVANREFSIIHQDGSGNRFAGTVASEIQTASLTDDYFGANFATSSGISAGLGTGAIGIGVPAGFLIAGFVIAFATYNIQGADAWGGGNILVEEWVMPN